MHCIYSCSDAAITPTWLLRDANAYAGQTLNLKPLLQLTLLILNNDLTKNINHTRQAIIINIYKFTVSIQELFLFKKDNK